VPEAFLRSICLPCERHQTAHLLANCGEQLHLGARVHVRPAVLHVDHTHNTIARDYRR
jgi:hypothetical protein